MFKVLAVIFFLLACMVVLGYLIFCTVSEARGFIGEYRRLKVEVSKWTIVEKDAREDFNNFRSLHKNTSYSDDDYNECYRCKELLRHAENELHRATYDMKRLWEDKFVTKIILPIIGGLAVATAMCTWIHICLRELNN